MEENENNKLALIYATDLALVEENSLNEKQLKQILQRTPKKYIHTRPAKGGGTWDYVTGGYMKKCLNIMFGWDWDFEIVDEKILHGEAIVKGKLTCRSNGKTIVKMQFGNKDIAYKTEKVFNEDGTAKMVQKYGKTVQETRPSEIPLSIGNDLKSAATDCLKKCAAEIGISADIYNKEDFNEVKVSLKGNDFVEPIEISDEQWIEIKSVFDNKIDPIPNDQIDFALKIINGKQSEKYQLLVDFLSKIK